MDELRAKSQISIFDHLTPHLRGKYEWERSRGEVHLVMSCCTPVGNLSWVCYPFLETMSAKCSEGNRGSTIDATNCPEWERHRDIQV